MASAYGVLARFRYVLQKIEQAEFRTEPFRHLHLADLFDEDHFQAILACRQIRLPPVADDRALVGELAAQGYQPIPFPGTTDVLKPTPFGFIHAEATFVMSLRPHPGIEKESRR